MRDATEEREMKIQQSKKIGGKLVRYEGSMAKVLIESFDIKHGYP